VALFRYVGGKWSLCSDTAEEFRSSVVDARFRATDYAAKLVAGELGQCPFRFFRDNAI
jgi:hypothetical protein